MALFDLFASRDPQAATRLDFHSNVRLANEHCITVGMLGVGGGGGGEAFFLGGGAWGLSFGVLASVACMFKEGFMGWGGGGMGGCRKVKVY